MTDFQFFIRRDKHAHDHEPDREQKQDEEDTVPSLPDGSFATRAEIAVTVIHFSGYYRRKSLCHQVLRRFAATDCISQLDPSDKASRFCFGRHWSLPRCRQWWCPRFRRNDD